ncbi:hypothetical protein [Corynebacterium sp. A21]|uniref:hypothetical protein n=1 Tax=Corynebacterium sp. A21 TaxID=3457318 RepID=UPI003FD3E124
MSDFTEKAKDVLSGGKEKAGDAAEQAREKLASDPSNADEQTLNEKLGRAHLDHSKNDGKFGGND